MREGQRKTQQGKKGLAPDTGALHSACGGTPQHLGTGADAPTPWVDNAVQGLLQVKPGGNLYSRPGPFFAAVPSLPAHRQPPYLHVAVGSGDGRDLVVLVGAQQAAETR